MAEHTCTKHQPGTATCYRDHSCRCDDCRSAGNAFGKRCRAGLTRRIPVEPVAAHLVKIGLTDLQAARMAGVTRTTVTRIRTGAHKTVLRDTARRLLALTATPSTVGSMDSVGTTRRLRALAALGYTSAQIATESGIPSEYVRKLMQGGRTIVKATTAARVSRCYDTLSMVRPVGWLADRQRRQSAAKGWLPPLCWDDDDLDNPDPAVDQAARESTGSAPVRRTDNLIEAVEAGGTSLADLTERFSIKPESIYTALKRAGRTDLWDQIAPHIDHNQSDRRSA